MIGNQGRHLAMSDKTRDYLDTFWELVDEILNAVLFVLIGLEVLAIRFDPIYLLAGIIGIAIVLFAALSVSAYRYRCSVSSSNSPSESRSC